MTNSRTFCLALLLACLFNSTTSTAANANLDDAFLTDGLYESPLDTLPPIKDREGDFFTNDEYNPFDLDDPPSIEKEVTYDPESGYYIITETVGGQDYRPPTYLTLEEYLEYSAKAQRRDYFSQLSADAAVGGAGKDPIDRYKANLKSSLVDRLFGGTTVDIRPNGNINLTFGGDYQKVDNPIIPEQQRRQGGFDFDMSIQMNIIGKIGEKLKLSTSYNTQATFDFQNQMKLEYTGFEDEIIQKIEAGNVSLPLKSSLIQGSQSLFGVKTELKFGRLSVAAVVSQKKSKQEQISVQGGAQVQTFEVTADRYDENRHFFLTHFNRNEYEKALEKLPIINTLFKITKMEVWVTNDRNATEDVRDIVALMDLGEPNRVNPGSDFFAANPLPTPRKNRPSNSANALYSRVANNPNARNINTAVSALTSSQLQLEQTEEFEKVRARLLNSSEYSFHPELGYVSLNVTLPPDATLGVAFEYSYGGQIYQVGEFTNDVPENMLFVKMLKSTTARVDLPIWDLMMKNIYAIGAFQVNAADFELDVVYQDPGLGEKRFISEGPFKECPLITALNLDNLNSVSDPFPDGNFDFIPGVTINPRNGRIMFPVLEPFGASLDTLFYKDGVRDPVADEYVYDELYDSTVTVAREFAEYNRFLLRGSYKSSVSSEISLGAFNIPKGSVTVTSGGTTLREGIDYDIDYNIGRVRILNETFINSGAPVNVSFEDNALFGFNTQTMFGTRLDYELTKDINIGGTFMRLSERPFTQKVNVGDDPIANSVYGLDVRYSKEAPWITRALDKLPLLQTKEPSRISFSAEGAMLRPGHSKALNNVDASGDKGGTVFLDDFEGSVSSIPLGQTPTNWALASTPRTNEFPESDVVNNLDYGKNRALLNWYRINTTLDRDDSDYFQRQVNEQSIFPNRSAQNGINSIIRTFDMAYYPSQPGPYNFDADPTGISAGLDYTVSNNTGTLTLNDPGSRWAGIQRSIQTTDFEAANIEFIEFWVMSPFMNNSSQSGGQLYFNLGSVSEDILRDSRNFFENGLPTGNDGLLPDTTTWSQVPSTPDITGSFANDIEDRTQQDLGLDGFNNTYEREHFAAYMDQLTTAGIDNIAFDDPSHDDYIDVKDPVYEGVVGDNVLERYKAFNNPQGNALEEAESFSNIPDREDLNRDNTLSETESFYQYQVPLNPDPNNNQFIEQNRYMTDMVGNDTIGYWYQFKIPVEEFTSRVGGIQDFRSIRFIRMYMKGFEERTVLRFARLELVRNQWRRFNRPLVDMPSDFPVQFDVTSVSIEENSDRFPFNYVLPPGVTQENSIGAFPNAVQNEQSLSMEICDLGDGDARGIYKIINLDMRRYKRLKMFTHAESETDLNPGEATVFIRMGSDILNNYYEYEIPLTMSVAGSQDPEDIWPDVNEFDFPLDLLRDAKVQRNNANFNLTDVYTVTDPDNPENNISILGNPDLGLVKNVMIGIRNKDDANGTICTEVWVNELRLSGLDERGGVAATARMDITLADLGNLSASTNYTGIGWGSLEQKVNQRSLEEVIQYDVATNLELGKFLPKKSGIRLPFYAQYSKTVKNPEFDPYQLDIDLKESLRNAESQAERDTIKERSQDVTAIKSINLTNVRKERTNTKRKPMPYDVENLSATYAWSNTFKRDPIIESDNITTHRAALDYQYSAQVKPIEPLKKVIKSKSKWLGLVKEFNFNPLPNSFNFGNNLNRHKGEITYRFSTGLDSLGQPKGTYFDKRFTWDRNYGLRWDLTKSISFNYSATNNSVIDEKLGNPRIEGAKDTLRKNLLRFGRTKNYSQTAGLSYTLPTKLIPILDWTTVKASYSGNYSWSAAPQNAENLGNIIQNGQSRQASADLDFVKLYNKVKYLKKINAAPKPKSDKDKGKKKPTPKKTVKDKNGKEVEVKEEREPSMVERVILRPLMTLRKGRFSYSEQLGSVVPGYTPRTRFFGMGDNTTYQDVPTAGRQSLDAPGWDYVFGLKQADNNWLLQAGEKGWITNDTLLNQQVNSSYTQSFDGKITLEPFKDFRIDLNMSRSYSTNETKYYRFDNEPLEGIPGLRIQNELETGSVDLTFFTLGTMFQKLDTANTTAVFQQFKENRATISQRYTTFGSADYDSRIPTDSAYVESDGDYGYGYGEYQQNVLIPAFLAAYTKKDAGRYKLNVFGLLPRPNWKISYNGLSKIKAFKKIFSSFNLSHGYTSKLSVNSFRTDFDYVTDFGNIRNDLNNITGNYYSEYEIPDIVISEQLSPLIGLDVRFKNDLSAKFDWKKTRNLALNLVDFQMTETRTEEFTIGLGYRLKGVKLPFDIKIGKKKKEKLENDLEFKFELSFRDDKTISHYLTTNQSLPTRGLKTIRWSPTIDYAVNKQLSIRLFFDTSRTIPATQASFPITNSSGGVQIRFTLSQ